MGALGQVAVLGAGRVGRTLASRWSDRGLDVTIGSRRDSVAGAGTIQNALDGAEVVVLAVAGAHVADVLAAYGDDLNGKIIVDVTNNLTGPPVGRVVDEQLHQRPLFERWAPDALWCRSFCSVSVEVMASAGEPGDIGRELFYIAPEQATEAVEALISAAHFAPVRVGGPEHAGTLDGLTRAYFTLMATHGKHVSLGLAGR